MSAYEITLPDIGLVKVTKKRGQSSLRIRLNPKGDVLVSAPWSLPKIAIEKYLNTKKTWIIENRPDYDFRVFDGLKFGESLILLIHENAIKNRSKLQSNNLHVFIKGKFDIQNKLQKNYIEKRMLNALKLEAEVVLLPKLNQLAETTGHSFNQAYVKNLKSRWGSCDRDKNIILNVFLLQLPQELHDYVVMHELAHTKHMDHSKKFWDHLSKYVPQYKRLRKELKVHQPRLEERI